jgi:GNAT superfamily N-acetyltransferase
MGAPAPAAMLIGPEGGFSPPAERARLAAGLPFVTPGSPRPPHPARRHRRRGRADAVALVAAIGLDGARKALDEDEPQFVLDLGGLVVPEGPGRLVPLGHIPEETAIGWRRDYLVEILGTPPERAETTAASDIANYVAEDSHRALVDRVTPLAMTGFNARLPDIVQVGAVYTPPLLRSRGLARRAVALHLAEAKARGVGQATLFASGPAAVRAYEALGFRRTGTWTIVLLAEPEAARG